MEALTLKDKNYYTNSRAEMLRYIDNSPATALEIGCGAGAFSQNLNEIEYWGVEPNQQMATLAANNAHKVLLGTYDEVEKDIPNGYFDIVICNDVIEHMTDPIKFLTDIKSKLSHKGKLIASIPNLRYAPLLYDLVLHGHFNYTKSGILDYTHFHLFTQNSFKAIANDCNWNIEVIEPIGIQDFKPLKKLILRFLEHGNYGEMRSNQFAVRMSPR